MFTPTTDYNQQLLGYLQTWRQLLEQWTTMAAGLPSPTALSATPFMPPMPQMPPTVPFMPQMPPTVPFMPPMAPSAPVPPLPADYTQQLFSYLQAWRQYLEQMTGGRPPVAQPPTAQPANAPENQPANAPENHPANHRGQARPVRPPDVPVPPDKPEGTKGDLGGEVRKGSDPKWPPLVDVAPRSVGGQPGPPGKPLRLCEPLHPWTRGAECAEAARLRHRASIRPLQPRTRHIGPGRLINPARTLALHNGGTGPASSGIAISRRNGSRRTQYIAAIRAEVALLQFYRTNGVGPIEGSRSNALSLRRYQSALARRSR